MSEPFENVPFPIWPLRAAAGLAVFALVVTALARYFGLGTALQAESPVRIERDLRFVEHLAGGASASAGGIDVVDARTGLKIDELRPGADGFMRATLRGLARERRRNGLGQEVPFQLALHADGSLTLLDPATSRRIELQAFGPSNSGAFARLLTAGPHAATRQPASLPPGAPQPGAPDPAQPRPATAPRATQLAASAPPQLPTVLSAARN
jgi:putative photosynthetic complex assembly protein